MDQNFIYIYIFLVQNKALYENGHIVLISIVCMQNHKIV